MTREIEERVMYDVFLPLVNKVKAQSRARKLPNLWLDRLWDVPLLAHSLGKLSFNLIFIVLLHVTTRSMLPSLIG